MSELEESLEGALMSGIQTGSGVGSMMHPDAQAIVCIAFRDALSAERFKREYVRTRYRLNGLPDPVKGTGK